MGRFENDPDLWAAAYVPEYSRFDTTERKQHPIEWNIAAAGVKINYDTANTIWLIRSQYHGFAEGLALRNGSVGRTASPEELGYNKPVTHVFSKSKSLE